jgi:lysophospholipase L1-like esterase
VLACVTTTADAFATPSRLACIGDSITAGVGASNQIVPIITGIATDRRLPIIDVHAALSGMPAVFPDGVHPNDQGHLAVARVMYKGLLSPTIPTPDAGMPDEP